MILSTDRGHETYYKDGNWFYKDTGYKVDHTRACKRCGQPPTKEGHDACLGHIEGVSSACCGHGVGEKIMIKDGEE